MTVIPPYLQPGNTIGITCPAGFMAPGKAAACIQILQSWGYEVMVGKTLTGISDNYFSGTDEERTEELQAMLDDKHIHAIVFGRGGYGVGRIIDQLNFKKFCKYPKWLVGYSDITVLHNHILTNYGIASLHAPMAGAFSEMQQEPFYLSAWKDAIEGRKAKYTFETHPLNRKADVSGILTGGNLSLLSNIIGSSSEVDTKNKILFIEDIGEYYYKIDRMLYQLKRSGQLKKLAGLVVGGFTDMKDTERPFGKPLEQIIKDAVAAYSFPVCFNFPVSHTLKNVPLKVGVRYRLKVGSKTCHLIEM